MLSTPPSAPTAASVEEAIQAFEQDPMYVVAMVEAHAMLRHKREVWAKRRLAAQGRTTPE